MAYIRTTWQKDDVITADKLNNIEEGIKEVEDNGLTIGTTASTAKAGNYHPTWAQVTNKPATFPPTIGTTASTAKAGDYAPTWSEVTGKPSTFSPSAHTHAWADITGKPEVIASGATQAAARTAIGAGTSNLAIGTTASTAKAGNYQPTAANISDASAIGRTVLTSADAGAVRSAIGAGTSSLALGTTASQAAAGNHNHAVTAHTDSGLEAAANIQALAQALSARIKALEDASDEPVE